MNADSKKEVPMDANEIIQLISDRVKDTANVQVIFGEPIVSGGVTIVPVASIRVAGGGGKTKAKVSEQGADSRGMGLKVVTRPLGYIEIKEGHAVFVPIPDVTKIAVGGMVVAGLALMTAVRVMQLMAWKKQKMEWRHPRLARNWGRV